MYVIYENANDPHMLATHLILIIEFDGMQTTTHPPTHALIILCKCDYDPGETIGFIRECIIILLLLGTGYDFMISTFTYIVQF